MAIPKNPIALSDGHGMLTAGKRTPEFTDGTISQETKKRFMHENEFNRAVVKYLDEHLRRIGFKTLLVAPTDADTPLSTRTNLADARDADIYLSIHANALLGKWGNAKGIETFYFIGSKEGERLARIVHKELIKGTKLADRGLKSGNHLWEVRKPEMPAVLVECGFMDNLSEAKLLLSDAYRKECAEEIARGVCAYYDVAFTTGKAATTQPESNAEIDTNKGIGTVKIKTDGLSFRKDPNADGALIKTLNAGALFYAYEKSGMWYNLGGGWASEGAGKDHLTFIAHPKMLYRVRKTWADVASQTGAFYDLASARIEADKEGLTVFSESGTSVYLGKKPVVAMPVVPVVPVVPIVKDVHEGHSTILGESVATVEQMVAFLKAKNPSFPAQEVAEQFLSVGKLYGIRGDVAFCQSIIETGWFKFDGGTAVTPDQHNYCGMGVTSKGMKGASFKTVREGISGQMQHLFAYASKLPVPTGEVIVDPRFKYVTRGIAPHWEDLSMRWAMNDKYGVHILSMYEELKKVVVPKTETPKVEIAKEDAYLTSVPAWAQEDVKRAVAAEVTDGLNLGEQATRLQVTVMFGRLLKHLENK
jgi:N-acetylmuramoyl-L-alanine amidase